MGAFRRVIDLDLPEQEEAKREPIVTSPRDAVLTDKECEVYAEVALTLREKAAEDERRWRLEEERAWVARRAEQEAERRRHQLNGTPVNPPGARPSAMGCSHGLNPMMCLECYQAEAARVSGTKERVRVDGEVERSYTGDKALSWDDYQRTLQGGWNPGTKF
jgi:hypothetical protein